MTQVTVADLKFSLTEQEHEALVFAWGYFKECLFNSNTSEKNSILFVYAMARLDHLTSCAHTHIHTDHRNVCFVLDLANRKHILPLYFVAKVQRWAPILSQFEYRVSHIAGEMEPTPELVTRWGSMPSNVRHLAMSFAKQYGGVFLSLYSVAGPACCQPRHGR